ncbi:ActS/PrrB/RegB family redox-sensitive histidine kinase [Dongia sp.]|uniref:ActS/PrrB/RegB family redox-sensitive histidine kinase n=1 Tax=Dongia sp. TaxID=1977262 RepID=UPI0035AF47A2
MSEVTSPPISETEAARRRASRRPARGRVRLRTLLAIRWVAVTGQAASLLFVDFVLGYPIPLLLAVTAVAALAAATLVPQIRRKANARLNDRESALYFAFDMVQLSVLLALTGGLHNPFSLLLLAPVTVSAAALSFRSTLGLTALAITCINILALFHLPLPWPGSSFDLPPIFVFGLTIALGLAVVFISVYVFKVAEESRRVTDALMAVQSALDREQRISSVGALAAAAAHELGSPLGTISLIAKELTNELPAESPYRADAELLLSQADRCRHILAEIAARPEQSSHDHFHVLAAPLLVELAAEPFLRPSVALRIEARSEGGEQDPPLMPRRPEIMHGLGNLLQNAIEFAKEEVQVVVAWSRAELSITITDDGVGFPPDLLARLGDPYISAAMRRYGGGKLVGRVGSGGGRAADRRKGDHMGLGIFIAQNLLERSGGNVQFGNNDFGGAEVKVVWPRSALAHEASRE